MIDRFLLPTQRAVLHLPARLLLGLGLGADQVTLIGFGLGLAGALTLAMGWYHVALGLIFLNRIADGLDGAMARQTGSTDRGAFLDVSLDFLFYALIPMGFAFANPAANALASAVLIASFVGTGSSFLAYSLLAERRGITTSAYPSKGIYYLGGLAEGAETIAFFVASCLWPTYYPALAWVFATVCFATTLIRWHMGWRSFGPDTSETRHL